jgi:phosphatidylinositol glycan class F
VGAWVIPLDWDRPWQLWPIPCVLGAVGGYALTLLAAQLCVWRRIKDE